ncbi:Hsp20 family protein [Nitratifractor salsuginis]|uniref:Heat shock protein Hsp20 n=1 Tax=Nitratifractor salsuginis (strain DSM 16511 / JCM 12458 / E9I37-1) TaxID=749222 RepID=E6X145_NITSE|nr:Hsp20 family protein [Nitratifractor salsuginis]ADV45848.1 heat shock protein Hsp20 [Nitratifractor salsuginis DSM 16511]
MKRIKYLLSGLAAASVFGFASAPLATTSAPAAAQQNDPFAQMDHIFQMQMKQMELMRKQMDAMFRNFEQSFQTPAIAKMPILVHSSGVLSSGIQDKGDHYELQIKVSDLKNSKVKVTTENGMLTVEVTEQKKEEKTSGNYGKIISYANSSSVQSFTLPDDADTSGIKATQKDNTILIIIPKKSAAKSGAKVIPVQKSKPEAKSPASAEKNSSK